MISVPTLPLWQRRVLLCGSFLVGYGMTCVSRGVASRWLKTTLPPPTVPIYQKANILDTAPDEAWQELVRSLMAEALGYRGRVGIYIKDLDRGKIWAYHADDLFPSASLIKVPVMAAVFQKIAGGEMHLDAKMTLRRRWRTGGSGSLKWYRDGATFAVRELMEHMITESDNTAQRMLVDSVGFYYLQQQFPKFGLTYTQINPEGLSLTSGKVTYENYTTAREMAGLLEKMYHGELVNKVSSELMLDIMKRQKNASRLAKGLPTGWEIAHKTGLLRRACHDIGVVFTPHGNYVIAVMTGQNVSYRTAKNFISRLAKLTYRHYGGEPQDLASVKGRFPKS
ncbi:MAG: serine hydrolase [Elusimicrobia bacterium]|nr:serine hydrolase [Elusimicrobiota bacterium]